MKNKFTKPPLSLEEKEKKAIEFITGSEKAAKESHKLESVEENKKEPLKSLFLRAPKSYWDDIQEIMSITGLSMNAVCLELLRPALKRKLKELKED